jgi:leader peptidase (prepilin peptidase)/N-methyltransferase
MNLAFSSCSAVVAAASAWPASATIGTFGGPTGRSSARPADAEDPGAAEGTSGLADHANLAGTAAAWRPAPAGLLLAAVLAASAWAITARLQPAMVGAAACWLAICGAPLAAIDIRVRRLPNRLTAVSLAGVLGLLAIAAIRTADWPDLLRAAAGGLAVGALFGLLALTRPGSAGLGDAKLGLSTGALAGWFGWRVTFASVVAAFVLAAAYGLWLVATRRATLHGTSLPFGPFLLAGCLAIVLLAGPG